MVNHICFLLMILLSLVLKPNYSMSQDDVVIEYYFISVDFYSAGQGVDKNAYTELLDYMDRTRKKHRIALPYEAIHWGKEGERTIYIDIRKLPASERLEFMNDIQQLFRDRNKMAIVRSNLSYEPAQKYLVLGISMFGQFEDRENKLLSYMAGWEKRSRFKINSGDMINETAIPEDQDRRNQLNLSGLKDEQIREILEKAQDIMKISNPENIYKE